MKNNKGRKLFAGMALLFVCSLATGAGTKIILNNRFDTSVISSYASVSLYEMEGRVAVGEIEGQGKFYCESFNDIFTNLTGITAHVDLYIQDSTTDGLDLSGFSSANWTIYIVNSNYSSLGGNYYGNITIPSGSTITLGEGVFWGTITNSGTLKLSANATFDKTITTSSAIDANGYTGDLTVSMGTTTSGTVVITNYTSGTITVENLPSKHVLHTESTSLVIRQPATVKYKNTETNTNITTDSSSFVGCGLPTISFSTPTKTNHTFKGFYSAINGGGTKYYNEDLTPVSNLTIPSASFTVYTYWEEDVIDANYTAPTAKTNLKYNGEAQELVNAGSCEGGSVEYSLDESSWSSSLPTGTNVGGYVVYYRIVKNSSNIASGNVNVNIAKGDPTLNSTPTAKSLTYTGSNQELINVGICTNGSFKYKLDEGAWGDDIPQAMAVGTYNVYWKIAGNPSSNYNDTSEQQIVVNIEKANLNISISNIVKTYDGSSVNISTAINSVKNIANTDVNYTVLFGTTEGVFDQTDVSVTNVSDSNTFYYEISYEATNYNIATGSFTATINKVSVSEPVSFTSKNFTGGILKPDISSDKYFVVSEYINAGTYDVELQLYDKTNYTWSGTDNSNNVTIDDSFTINKVAMTYTTGNVVSNFTYDGTEHNLVVTANADTVDNSGENWMFSDDNINWVSTINVKNVADSKTYYYKISVLNHNDKFGSFEVVISKKDITITAKTEEFKYNGEIQYSTGYSKVDGLCANESVDVAYDVNSKVKNVSDGIVNNVISSVAIFNNNSEFINDNYNIAFIDGEIKVIPRTLCV